jgi:dTDP-4-dehydrorhamnose 3,5-epimerase
MPYGKYKNIKSNNLDIKSDARGSLAEILRADNELFEKFGQVYFTKTLPLQIRGIHRHRLHADMICCISGMINLLTISDENNCPHLEEILLDGRTPVLIKIPTKIWHGWQCISEEPALVVSITETPFNPAFPDAEQVDPIQNLWSYKWK